MKLSKRYVFRYYKRHPMKRSFFQDNLFLKITTHSTLQVIHIQSFIFYFPGDCSSPIKRSFFWTTFSIEKTKNELLQFHTAIILQAQKYTEYKRQHEHKLSLL